MREDTWKSKHRARDLRAAPTRVEAILWSKLRRGAAGGHRFRRQHPIDDYIVDFACVPAKLIIEIDGATHSTCEELAHDAKREAFLTSRGWQVLRFQNDEVFHRLEAVMETIYRALPPPRPTAGPPPQAVEEE